MILKETAFAYNVTTDTHSNSDWGAEIGQGNKKLMNVDGVSELLNGMLYYKVDDVNQIKAVLGKGNRTLKPLGEYLPDTSIVIASVFPKVYVNGIFLEDQQFIMFVTKDERKNNNQGTPNVHYQRRSLKFSDKATFDDIPINQNCINAISEALGCTEQGSWIITDINFIDDFLELTAVVVNKNSAHDFKNKIERSDFLKRAKLKKIIDELKCSEFSGNLEPIILYGPPGTGKTYTMQTDYISKYDQLQRFITTFHQSFSYEEFVEGLKPELNGEEISYHIEKGVFYQACERAAITAGYSSLKECVNDNTNSRKAKFEKAIEEKRTILLCIDEINRGNVASIFGDLISLIEPSKRLGAGDLEMIVSLPYSKECFGVPANLLIVGTMNTADRSIQLLDSALRRRFKFKELLPQAEKIEYDKAKNVLNNINARVRCLLNKDNQIGHSYLMNAKNFNDIITAMVEKIIPLLEEYFYNDMDKVRFVIGDKDKKTNFFYVEDKEAKAAHNLFINGDVDEEDQDFYHLNSEITTAIDNKDEDKCKKFLEALLNEDGE